MKIIIDPTFDFYSKIGRLALNVLKYLYTYLLIDRLFTYL